MPYWRLGLLDAFIFDGKVYASDELKLAKSSRFAGDVVLIKGGFDVFSGGFDKIATKLAKKGIKATVSRHTKVKQIANQIIANRKKYGRKPVVLIGHSWGANAVMEIASILKRNKIRVNYAVTFAATNPNPYLLMFGNSQITTSRKMDGESLYKLLEDFVADLKTLICPRTAKFIISTLMRTQDCKIRLFETSSGLLRVVASGDLYKQGRGPKLLTFSDAPEISSDASL